MASTFTQIYLHIVFGTKNRHAWIAEGWRGDLHAYIAGGVRKLGARAIAIGGVADHVHILVELKSSHCLKDFMRDLKSASSKWIHTERGLRQFQWQEGYAAFSVSEPSRDRVVAYIHRQEEHHKKTSFRDELIAMLERAKISYDERYLD